MTNIPLNIKRLMKEKNIDQTQLANLLGVTQGSVSQWLTGRTTPRGKKLEQLAAVFGVTVSELMSEEKKEDTSKEDYIRELEQKLLKATTELLEYKTRENERLKNNQDVPIGQ